jgi:hypothetical protein
MRKSLLLWAFSFLVLLIIGCKHNEDDHAGHSGASSPDADYRKGTLRMIDSLNAIYSRTNIRNHPYESAAKVALIEKELAANKQPTGNQLFEYAYELLKAGKSKEAAKILEQFPQRSSALREINEGSKPYWEFLALTYLRLGEQENCIINHNEESCLFPIQGKGVHTKEEGSRAAIQVYEQLLEKFPDDQRSRYLLNVAYMTLGEYPDKVPARWRIDPKSLKSEYPLPHFTNIAPGMGFNENGTAGGSIADDFDNDGLLDLMITSWNLHDQVRFYKNNGDGTFTERTDAAGLTGLTGGLNIVQTDYNNDGNLDFLILRGAWKPRVEFGIPPNSLVRNNGDGTFSDVTFEAGIYTTRPTQAAVWFDFDRDGWLDLFIGNESVPNTNSYDSEFYRNNGDGTFTEMPASAGLKINAFVKGVSAGDVNNDGYDDLYVSIMKGANRLFINKGGTSPEDWKFEEVSAAAGVQEPMLSFPTWMFDFNNDGLEDIFVGSFDNGTFATGGTSLGELRTDVHVPRLYQNNGNGSFTEISKQFNFKEELQVMGSSYGDLDNDGFQDIYLGTGDPDFRSIFPNKMYRNNAGKSFQDVTTAGGFGHIQKGHSIAFADFDQDGDQDIYAVMGGAYSGDNFQDAFYENPGNKNKWIILQLEGTKSNRAAIGARIRVTIKDSKGNPQTIYSHVSNGGSFSGNSLQQEIGLGDAKGIEKIEIKWPNKDNQYVDYGKADMNQKLKFREGDPQPTPVALKAFTFKKNAEGHHHH